MARRQEDRLLKTTKFFRKPQLPCISMVNMYDAFKVGLKGLDDVSSNINIGTLVRFIRHIEPYYPKRMIDYDVRNLFDLKLNIGSARTIYHCFVVYPVKGHHDNMYYKLFVYRMRITNLWFLKWIYIRKLYVLFVYTIQTGYKMFINLCPYSFLAIS